MPYVLIGGVKHKIVEALGYNHDVGSRAWLVLMPDGSEKMAVGTSKNARLWGARDRVAPLLADKEFMKKIQGQP